MEFIDSLEREKAEKAAEEVAKADRAQAREDRKAAKAELEERWKKIKADHLQAVVQWETRCATLIAGGGVRKKDLPKKPKRPKKPELPKDDDSDNDSSGSDSE